MAVDPSLALRLTGIAWPIEVAYGVLFLASNEASFVTVIESNLEFIAGQLSRLPTRGDLAKAALGIIISTAALVILWAEPFWRL
jgi:hypothetical protein